MLYEVITHQLKNQPDSLALIKNEIHQLRITSYNVCYTKLLRYEAEANLIELWKYFLLAALLFAIAELLIIRFWK